MFFPLCLAEFSVYKCISLHTLRELNVCKFLDSCPHTRYITLLKISKYPSNIIQVYFNDNATLGPKSRVGIA